MSEEKRYGKYVRFQRCNEIQAFLLHSGVHESFESWVEEVSSFFKLEEVVITLRGRMCEKLDPELVWSDEKVVVYSKDEWRRVGC